MIQIEASRYRVLFLLLLGTVVYLTALPNGFVWDDYLLIVDNTAVHDLSNLPDYFSDPTSGATASNQRFYRPLRTLSYALLYGLFGSTPWPYHLLNLLLHLVNVRLVFAVTRRLAGSDTIGLVVAALFAVHPLMTEAVANVTGLTDVGFTAFYLGSVLGYLRWREEQSRWWLLCLLLFPGALLFKEMALTLPLVLAAVELLMPRDAKRSGKPAALLLGGLATIGLGYFMLRTGLLGTWGQQAEYPGGTFRHTMLMQVEILAKYLRLTVLPFGQSVRHSTPIPLSPFEPRVLISGAVMLAVGAAFLASLSRDRRVSLGLAWFFIALAPVMNVIPIQGDPMGERFLYLPLVGLFLAAVCAAERLGRAFPEVGSALPAATLLVLAVLSIATFQRNRVWKDDLTLFSNAARVAPDSNAVRLVLIREHTARGNQAAAREQYDAAAANTRRYHERYRQLGDARFRAGDLEESLIFYRRALRSKTDDDALRNRIAEIERSLAAES